MARPSTRPVCARRDGRRRPVVLALALVMLLASGCSGGSTPALRTGPGVTAGTITLGVLTDLSGAFAPFGRAVTTAAQVYYDQVNRQGGICGRQVQLAVRDHGYSVEKAQGLYADLQPRVLGFEQLLGSPMTSTLLPSIAADGVLTAPASSGSALLENPYIAVMGATYDIELIDALDYLRTTYGLRPGDTVGHVYQDTDYGLEGALGSRYAAGQFGLKLVELRVDPNQDDLTDQVAALVAAKVKAVLLTTGPRQTAALVGTAAAAGLLVPFAGNNPTFAAALLRTPAAPALQKLFVLVGPSAPYSSRAPAVRQVVDALRAADPGAAADNASIYGWATARGYADILRRACGRGDLTRGGVAAAFHATDHLVMDGLMPDLDFSHPGAPATRQVFVDRPDPAAAGGLRQVATLLEAPAARSYRAPAER
jgi:ABC-type branched-subunit amino acid transport system substrate-binding protein